MKFYTDSIVRIEAKDCDTLVMKQIASTATSYSAVNGFIIIDTAGFSAGDYYLQFMANDAVVKTDKMTLLQNLLTASEDFDPRSDNEKTLAAIEAMLAGRATTQQRSISIDGQTIQYSSFSELMEWKNNYTRKVAEEKGLKKIKAEYIRFKDGLI